MRASELTGKDLDYWTLMARRKLEKPPVGFESDSNGRVYVDGELYSPTTNGGQCFELIDILKQGPIYSYSQDGWHVIGFGSRVLSDDPKTAICRAVVASVFGEEVSG